MAKFSGTAPIRVPAQGPIRVAEQVAPTYEGGDGRLRDAQSELFLLAVTNMVGEATFYEASADRDKRYRDLIADVVRTDSDWLRRFVPFLRDTMQMRSASTVMAAEYVYAGGPNGRSVVSSALQRADEPAEILGYWHATHGRKLPAALKRGIADACQRLYTERASLRYDGQDKAIRFGDVIDLVHPVPSAGWQSELFRYLLDKRHKRADPRIGEGLRTIPLDLALMGLPEDQRRSALRDGRVAAAGWSWERLAGWLPGGMDAEAWASVVPQMGYMALLRNLRNFEAKGIPEDLKDRIIGRLSDPDEVAKSRQFPYRFYSAYKANAGNLTWGRALERALDHSVKNIPAFDGRTLILVDLSGSMTSAVSAKSQMARYEIGALFGAALWKKGGSYQADLVCFGQGSARLDIAPGSSVLKVTEFITNLQRSGQLGHATFIQQAVQAHYDGHKRVVIFTDEQGHDNKAGSLANVPQLHVFNLAGYRVAMAPHGQAGVHSYGGFTDATFRLMPLLEMGREQGWPF
jgi:hypothetical protein